jgi:peroxiredoxin
MSSSTVYTNVPAPALVVPTLLGETFDLAAQNPDSFTIVVFYRGRHCPICIAQLKEIEASADQARAHGMNVIAISMDTKEKAIDTFAAVLAADTPVGGEEKKIAEAAAAFSLPIGYGMTEEQARSWGLYMSEGLPTNTAEPALFSEPGIYVVRPDKSIFFAQTQSAPFTRPNFQHLLGGLQFATQNNYPSRGTLTKKE